MAGYIATGRITQTRPRFVGSKVGWARVDASPIEIAGPEAQREPDPRHLDERLLERWVQAREEWAQATFFLFDPNSWR